MYLPLAGFPVRHLGSNDPVPKKVQSGVRSRQCCYLQWNDNEQESNIQGVQRKMISVDTFFVFLKLLFFALLLLFVT